MMSPRMNKMQSVEIITMAVFLVGFT